MNLTAFRLEPHVSKTVSVGRQFGRLTVLAIGKIAGTYKYKAVCRCDCGTVYAVRLALLKPVGNARCTCAHERTRQPQKHGLWKSPLYTVWWHMLRRCQVEKDTFYSDYGGRGVDVCERWQLLEAFHADMIDTYAPGLQIDRIDNDQGYRPDNCKWSTRDEQMRNRRSNILVTIEGQTKVLKDWAAHFGVNYHSVYHRVKKMGWEPVEALTTPFLPKSAPRRLVRP